MTAEEFERWYHFKPSDEVLEKLNEELVGMAEKFDAIIHSGNAKIPYHLNFLRSGKNLTYEFCNKKLQDNISTESFIFDIDGQLIYIDMEE
jgi:hypothetical protein